MLIRVFTTDDRSEPSLAIVDRVVEPCGHRGVRRLHLDLLAGFSRLQRIDQLLDGLPAKVKATFLLSQVDGLTYPQIAQVLGISPRSVSDYMAKALQRCLRVSQQ